MGGVSVILSERPRKPKTGRIEGTSQDNPLTYLEVKRSKVKVIDIGSQSIKALLLLLTMYMYICGGRILEQPCSTAMAVPLHSLL